jgi:hypothetical protein
MNPGTGVSETRSLKLPPSGYLASQAQFLNQCAVPLQVPLLEVVQEPSAAADELQQPAARVVVLRVRAQMLGQLVDALGEQCDLHLGRAGVLAGPAVLADDLLLRFLRESQFLPPEIASPQSKPP